MQNVFYKVESPILVFAHIGQSAGNTYIGSSRSINTVKHSVTLEPGDEIHHLVGGVYMVRGDEVRPISLRPPKHIFEKSYGGGDTPEAIIGRYQKAGRLSEAAALAKVDYGAASLAVRKNKLPDFQPAVVLSENSPEYLQLEDHLRDVVTDLRMDGHTVSWQMSDINPYSWPKATLKVDDDEFTFYTFEDFSVRLIMSQNRYDSEVVAGHVSGDKVMVDMKGEDANGTIAGIFMVAYEEGAAPTPRS